MPLTKHSTALASAWCVLACAGSSGQTSSARSVVTTQATAASSVANPTRGARRHLPPGSCGLAEPAFCEDFETPSPGGRGGDLDEARWAFSRWGHETRQHFVRIPAKTEPDKIFPPFFCGQPLDSVGFGSDVVSCPGTGVDGRVSRQLNEVYDDQGDFAFNSMMIRQPFDFTGRTGTIMVDVDAKVNPLNLGHGWWVELWVTEDPTPMPYHEAPGVLSYPRTGLGINLQGLNACPQGREATEVSRAFVSHEYRIVHDYPGWELEHDADPARCIKVKDQKLNRFKFSIAQDHVEVWASDWDDPLNLHRLVTIATPDLPFSRGYVHLQHSQYNARKDGGVTGSQTYRWDNVGFDGPVHDVPRSFAIPDNDLPDIDGSSGRLFGYYLTDRESRSLPIADVALKGATSAGLHFTYFASPGRGFTYSLNAGPPHLFTVPHFGDDRPGMRSFSENVPISELVDGNNVLHYQANAGQGDLDKEELIGNMELTLAGP